MKSIRGMRWESLLSEERPSKKRFQENEELALSAFERDYFTIIGSSYFRRLQGKTQVHTLDENDFVRNRLTHSMEVSCIASILGRKIAGRILKEHGEELPDEIRGDFTERLSMVLSCAGLLHDLGNPPFGHKGEMFIRNYFVEHEKELKARMTENLPGEEDEVTKQMWLDLVNFEGNAQNVRIVTKLGSSSNPNDHDHGMDLTKAVINSIIKYPYNAMENDPETAPERNKRGKIGYYFADEWVVKMVMETTGTKSESRGTHVRGLKDPVMLIMEAADDIAYATADIEDMLKKRLELGGESRKKLVEENGIHIDDIAEAQRRLKQIREYAITDVVNCFMENYQDIMDGSCEDGFELVDRRKCGQGSREDKNYNIKVLKESMREIYDNRDALNEYKYNIRYRICEVLDSLIHILLKEPADRSFKEWMMLEDMRQYLDKGEREVYNNWGYHKRNEGKGYAYDEVRDVRYHQYLAVVDYLSGMTDSYVLIYTENWHDEKYVRERMNVYKRECLEGLHKLAELKTQEILINKTFKESYEAAKKEMKMITRPFQNAAEKLLDRITHVDCECWDIREVAEILRTYLTDQVFQSYCEGEGKDCQRRKAYLEQLAEHYRLLSAAEMDALQALLGKN